jgi:hypothetical protein
MGQAAPEQSASQPVGSFHKPMLTNVQSLEIMQEYQHGLRRQNLLMKAVASRFE